MAKKEKPQIVAKLAKKLREERKARGLSQIQLSLKAGLNMMYVSMIEQERYSPTVGVIAKICKALEIKMSDFFKGLDND